MGKEMKGEILRREEGKIKEQSVRGRRGRQRE